VIESFWEKQIWNLASYEVGAILNKCGPNLNLLKYHIRRPTPNPTNRSIFSLMKDADGRKQDKVCYFYASCTRYIWYIYTCIYMSPLTWEREREREKWFNSANAVLFSNAWTIAVMQQTRRPIFQMIYLRFCTPHWPQCSFVFRYISLQCSVHFCKANDIKQAYYHTATSKNTYIFQWISLHIQRIETRFKPKL
jgi:hypothetical protein